MLLAIDVGNTNTVFAVYKGDKLAGSWRCTTHAARTADEYGVFLNQIFTLEDIELKEISRAIISSVVPEANFHLRGFCAKYLGTEPIMVDASIAGIPVDLDHPEEVGADRLVNAVAVKKFYKTPAIVIDFGTATTFDVIDAKGRYGGGAIAPGINLSIEALNRAASKLPKVSVKKPAGVIGKNTVGAIQSGIYWGYLGLIEGLVTKISAELGTKPFVIATGGLAPLFARDTKFIDEVDENLTLKGLLEIYQTITAKN